MGRLKERVAGTQQMSVRWDSGDDPLDEDDVLRAYDEYTESAALAGAVILLKDGQKIDKIGRFRERRRIEVDEGPDGLPLINQLETGMWHYLDELRRPNANNWRLLDEAGNFVRPILVHAGD
jgi:hypothetical protein